MSYVAVAYFTKDNIYTPHAQKFIQSASEYNVPYHVVPIDNLGDWYKNTQFKPTFLKAQLALMESTSIVYVDIDAVFYQTPILFEELDRDESVKVAAYTLDHSMFGRSSHCPELLSGTVFLRKCPEVFHLLDKWIERCRSSETIWDQVALKGALKETGTPLTALPPQYCTIFDYMSTVPNPVIVHNQASRKVRRNESNRRILESPVEPHMPKKASSKKKLPTEIPLRPTKVQRGGVIRYSRKWRNNT